MALDTRPHFSYTSTNQSSLIKDTPGEGTLRGSGRVRCLRAGPYTPFSGGSGHQPAGTMTGVRGASLDWVVAGAGNARSNCVRSAPPGWGELIGPSAPAVPREAW